MDFQNRINAKVRRYKHEIREAMEDEQNNQLPDQLPPATFDNSLRHVFDDYVLEKLAIQAFQIKDLQKKINDLTKT